MVLLHKFVPGSKSSGGGALPNTPASPPVDTKRPNWITTPERHDQFVEPIYFQTHASTRNASAKGLTKRTPSMTEPGLKSSLIIKRLPLPGAPAADRPLSEEVLDIGSFDRPGLGVGGNLEEMANGRGGNHPNYALP